MIKNKNLKNKMVPIVACPCCPLCVEEALGEDAEAKLFRKYHAWVFCGRHFQEIQEGKHGDYRNA